MDNAVVIFHTAALAEIAIKTGEFLSMREISSGNL